MSLDSPPTSETRNRRRLAMASAAVVAVIGVAACSSADSDEQTTASTVERTTVAPTTVEPTTVESIIVAPTTDAPTPVGPTTGTFVASGVDLTFAVPAGWTYHDDWYVANTNWSLVVFFDIVANIYTDSCPSELVDPPIGPTVDDLAWAWANLPGFNATAVSDITVDGFTGKQVEFTVPDYNKDGGDCPYGDFKLLEAVGGGAYWAQGPNQHHQLWILDVNGTRLVIAATDFPDTTPQDRAVIDEILASIQID